METRVMCLLCGLWMMLLNGAQPHWIRDFLPPENSQLAEDVAPEPGQDPAGNSRHDELSVNEDDSNVFGSSDRPSRSVRLGDLRALLVRSYTGSLLVPSAAPGGATETEEDGDRAVMPTDYYYYYYVSNPALPPSPPAASSNREAGGSRRTEEDGLDDDDDGYKGRRGGGRGEIEDEEEVPRRDYPTPPSVDDVIIRAVPDRRTSAAAAKTTTTTTSTKPHHHHPPPPPPPPPSSPSSSSSASSSSALESSLPPKIVTTGAPTAAPRPRTLAPSAVPARRPTTNNSSNNATTITTTTTTYPAPSMKTTPSPSRFYDSHHHQQHQQQQQTRTPAPRPITTTLRPPPRNSNTSPALVQMSLGSSGGGGEEENSLPKRTEPGAGSGSAGSAGSGGAGAAAGAAGEAVCLQYSTVQHDVSCGDGGGGGSSRKRRDVMTTRHLTTLLQHYGGSASTPFTAGTFSEASCNFRNLMPLGLTQTDEHIHRRFTARQLHSLLENHYAAPSTSSLAANGSDVLLLLHAGQNEAHRARRSAWMADEAGEDDEILEQLMNEGLELPEDFLLQMIPASRVTLDTTAPGSSGGRHKRTFNPANHQSYACRFSVDCQHFDASRCPGGRTRMVVDDNGCDTCRCTDTMSGYCQTTPRPGGGGPHVHLCTQCQQTRYLGPDVFPSYLQEVVCHPGNAPCLDISNEPQGTCQETHIPVSVLHRRPGRCMRVTLTDGQSLLFDDWLLAQHLVRTGCQCTLDKRSPLAAASSG